MEAAVSIKGKDFVVMAVDTSVKNSYLVLKQNDDKFVNINDSMLIAYLGDQGDAYRTSLYTTEKVKYEEVQGLTPTPGICANIIQKHVYGLLRTNPKNNYFMVGGLSSTGPELYGIDVYGTLSEYKYLALGISTYFCYGILDQEYTEDISIEDAVCLIRKCFSVLANRCSVRIDSIDIRVIKQDGISVVQ